MKNPLYTTLVFGYLQVARLKWFYNTLQVKDVKVSISFIRAKTPKNR